jgi:Holliday junction resolvasome RuvABC endonuclease subunit
MTFSRLVLTGNESVGTDESSWCCTGFSTRDSTVWTVPCGSPDSQQVEVQMRDIIVLGLDTGLKNIGYTVAKVRSHAVDDLDILDIGYLTTEKSSGKGRGVRVSDDNFERCRAVARTLLDRAEKNHPTILTFENMSVVRSSSVMAQIGMTFGVVATLAEHYRVPTVAASPQEIKLAVCGAKDASKQDVQAALDARFSEPRKQLDAVKLAASKREHPYDSLGSIVACWNTEVMRVLRTASGL